MSKKILIAMVIVAFVFGIVASSPSDTLNDLSLVNTMILRQNEDGGINMELLVSEKTKSTKGSSFKYGIISSEGNSISQCVSMAQNNTGKAAFFGHLKSVFFEQSFLKEEGNIEAFCEFAKRNNYINHYVTLFALDDKENKLSDAIKDEDDKVSDFLNSIVKKYPLDGIYTIKYNQMVNSNGLFCLPSLIFDESLTFNGLCIIQDNIYKAHLDTQEAKFYKILTNEANNITLKVQSGDIHIQKCKARLKYAGENNYLMNIKMYCDIEAYREEIDVIDKEEEETEARLCSYITWQLNEFMRKIQRGYESDIIGVGNCLRISDYSEYKKRESFNEDIFKSSNINISLDVQIIRNDLFK